MICLKTPGAVLVEKGKYKWQIEILVDKRRYQKRNLFTNICYKSSKEIRGGGVFRMWFKTFTRECSFFEPTNLIAKLWSWLNYGLHLSIIDCMGFSLIPKICIAPSAWVWSHNGYFKWLFNSEMTVQKSFNQFIPISNANLKRGRKRPDDIIRWHLLQRHKSFFQCICRSGV